MSGSSSHLEVLAATLQELAPGVVFWSGAGFLQAVPDLLREAVGEEWSPRSVEGFLSYQALAPEGALGRLSLVLAAPVPPDQLAALQSLEAAGGLECLVILEVRRTSGWGGWSLPLLKRPSATASYLEELGFQDSGAVDWESTERCRLKLKQALEQAAAQPPGFVVVLCPEESTLEVVAPEATLARARPPARTGPEPAETVFSRFAAQLKDRWQPSRMLWLDPDLEGEDRSWEQQVQMFCRMASSRPGKPLLVLPSRSLPALYASLRAWCEGSEGVPPLIIVRDSGIPTGPTRGCGGLTDGHLLLSVPNLALARPADEAEALAMLEELEAAPTAAAMVFTQAPAVGVASPSAHGVGQGRRLRDGKDLAILTLGATVYPALLAAESLQTVGLQVAVYDLRYRRPMDRALLAEAVDFPWLLTVEEGPESASFASHLLSPAKSPGRWLRLSVEVADLERQLADQCFPLGLESFGLHAEGIARTIKGALGVGLSRFG